MSSNIPKMKCLIIDDEPLARFHLKELAGQIDFYQLKEHTQQHWKLTQR